jgi:hypothetical protein
MPSIEEFMVLKAVCAVNGAQRQLVPNGATVSEIKDWMYDEGYGERESSELTGYLRSMARRQLVAAKPPPVRASGELRLVHGERARTKRWFPTLYGDNVATV